MKLKEIEAQVASLSADELREFSAWFDAYVADAWDRQIQDDARTGRLDKLVENLGIDLASEEGVTSMEEGFSTHRHPQTRAA